MFLLDKPNEICKNYKKFEKNTLSTKEKLLKRKKNYITTTKTNVQIPQTSSEGLKWTIHTYQMGNKNNLKWSLGNFKRKYYKLLCQLVLIYVMTLNQFSKLAKEKFRPSWGYFLRTSRNIYNLSKIMPHITPWTLILMLHIRQSVY